MRYRPIGESMISPFLLEEKEVESKNKLYYRCVRSLTLLDLLNSADPANCVGEELSVNKEACLLQLMTATTTIENILVNLSAADKSALEYREQYTVQLKRGIKESRNAVLSENIDSKSTAVSKTAPISFNEVVGNTEAKQALYENVILPLTISDLTKARVFSGSDCVNNIVLWMRSDLHHLTCRNSSW